MNIAVNLRQYCKGKIGGLENYLRHVLSGVANSRQFQVTIFALLPEANNVRELVSAAEILPLPPATAVDTIRKELDSGKYDAFWCPLLALEPLRPQIPAAVTIPDLQHEFYPEFFGRDVLAWRRQNYRPSTEIANLIFTVSEYSKRTLIEKFGADPGKIVVVDHDVDPEFRCPATAQSEARFKTLGLRGDYLYYPANFWPHKNHGALLSALKLLIDSSHPELSLVLTGSFDGSNEIGKLIASLGLRKHVRLLGYQPRDVVVELYRHARMLAFVSRFEGFGIPLLEAFHTGAPVVCSSSCSCPEVAGDAAVLVDESDPESIAGGIRSVLENESLARELIRKGRMRAATYSWDRAIKATIDALAGLKGQAASLPRVKVDTPPLVSITTPSFNMARFLPETIESVLTQDYPHIDYVVMDGGSQDGTLDILRKYEGRIRYESRPDRGQADAINRGFAASSGQIFAYLNADDTYLPGAVSCAVRHMLKEPEAGVAYGDAYYTDEAGNVIASYPTHAPDMAYLNRNCYICQPAAFMWRHAFENAGGMNVDQHYVLDYDLWMRIAKLYPFLKIDQHLATSRMYRENKTLGKRRLVYEEILRAVKTHFGYVPFDWVFGFACYLVDRKDQFFIPTKPSALKYAVSLLMGMYYNPAQRSRFWMEWATSAGLPAQQLGRWSDGWISKRYRQEYFLPEGCAALRISGKHWAPFTRPLILKVRIDNSLVSVLRLRNPGEFSKRFDYSRPPGTRCVLEITANDTFRPIKNGDPRALSCIIDEIKFESQ